VERTGGAVAELLYQFERSGWQVAECSLTLIDEVDREDRGGRLRAVLTELVHDITRLMRLQAACSGIDGPCVVEAMLPDGTPLEIDEVVPPVRAAMRALLASYNDCPEDVDDQIDLVLCAERPSAVRAVLVLLNLACDLNRWCQAHEPTPPGSVIG